MTSECGLTFTCVASKANETRVHQVVDLNIGDCRRDGVCVQLRALVPVLRNALLAWSVDKGAWRVAGDREELLQHVGCEETTIVLGTMVGHEILCAESASGKTILINPDLTYDDKVVCRWCNQSREWSREVMWVVVERKGGNKLVLTGGVIDAQAVANEAEQVLPGSHLEDVHETIVEESITSNN